MISAIFHAYLFENQHPLPFIILSVCGDVGCVLHVSAGDFSHTYNKPLWVYFCVCVQTVTH